MRQHTQDLAVAIRLRSHHGEEVDGTELPALDALFRHNVVRLPLVVAAALRLDLVAVAAAGKLPGTRAEETLLPEGLARCTPLQNLLDPQDKCACVCYMQHFSYRQALDSHTCSFRMTSAHPDFMKKIELSG